MYTCTGNCMLVVRLDFTGCFIPIWTIFLLFWNLCVCHHLNGCQQPMKDMFANFYVHVSLHYAAQRHNNLFELVEFHKLIGHFVEFLYFLITISPKNSMTNSTANNSTQQLTIYIQNCSLLSYWLERTCICICCGTRL